MLAQLAAAPYVVGHGQVLAVEQGVRLAIGPCAGDGYCDAQLDDYRRCDVHPGSGSDFSHKGRHPDDMCFTWRPPLQLRIRARFSHPAEEMRGTAGFGFWNDPVGMTGKFRVRPPQSVWFFLAGEPSQMPLALDEPGQGWMAAALDLSWHRACGLLPLAPVLAPALRIPDVKRRMWPWLRRKMALAGVALTSHGARLTEWRDYRLIWQRDHSEFFIDGHCVAHLPVAPRGPLGLVVWIDNQWLVATPQGNLRSGVTTTEAQWLELASLECTSL